MNIIKKEKVNFKIIGILIFVILGFTVFKMWPVKTVYMDAMFITDLSNNEKLVGISDNVFVGKVIKEIKGKKARHSGVNTLFEIEVIKNIKGVLDKKITIEQEGGYTKGGKVLVLGKDTELLKKGQVYLFSTRGIDKDYVFLTMHKNAMIKLNNNSLKDLERNNKVLEFKKAYVNEVNLRGKDSRRNSFRKLPEKEKMRLKNEIKNFDSRK